MSPVKVAPSILSADISRLRDEVQRALDAGADWIHVDVMDGHFVPNLTWGLPIVERLRKEFPRAVLDTHLMISNADQMAVRYAQAGASIVTVHVEAATHLHRTLAAIREAGAKAGVAVNPSTPVSAIGDIVPDLDLLLVMTVDPGFPAQRFIPTMVPKIEKARALLDGAGSRAELEVDGGIDPETAPRAVKAGARVLVAGNAVYGADEPLPQRIRRLRG